MSALQTLSIERPIRVLHVLGGLNRGGVETWLRTLLPEASSRGIHMDFLVHTDKPCAYDDEVRGLGSRIIPCLSPRNPLKYAKNFLAAVRRYGPFDVIHSHTYLFSGYVLALSRIAGIFRRVSHIYPESDLKSRRVLRAVERRALGRLISSHATYLLACSRSSLDGFRRSGSFDHLPSSVIYPSTLDLQRYQSTSDRTAVRRRYGLPVDKPLIVYVARFAPHKNHAQVFRVADRINALQHNVHFALVGSHGPLLESITQRCQSRRDVTALTGVPDTTAILQAADLFFFPSLNEGFGIVAVEAAAAGLPVVASHLPALEEAISPLNRRQMFQPDDDEGAINMINQSMSQHCDLSQDSRRWAERFAFQSSVDALRAVYQS